MTLTAELSHLILSTQPSAEAREKARQGVQDFIAVTWPVLQGHVTDSGLPALRRVYNHNDARSKALLFGYAGHALDFDDFHADFRGHPSTVILPALFALTNETTSTAEQFLDAYVIGVEVAGRLGLAAGQQHYTQGFHNTATLGTLAAAASVARLLGTTPEQTAVLLGIAATQASGLRAQFGSAVKPLHAGLAAQTAVSAAQLALAGFDGASDGVIQAFLAASSANQHAPEKLIEHWGQPWRIVSPGLEFKPYATCSGTHSAADATRVLRQQWLDSGETLATLLADISHIDVAFPPGGDIAASVRVPNNGIEARFSLEYVIAGILLYDDLRLPDFAEGDVNPEIMALAAKVQRTPDETAPPDALNPAIRFHLVTIYLRDGRTFSCRRTRQESLAMPFDLAGKLASSLGETAARREALIKWSALRQDEDLDALGEALSASLS